MSGIKDTLQQSGRVAVALACGKCGELVGENQKHECSKEKEDGKETEEKRND